MIKQVGLLLLLALFISTDATMRTKETCKKILEENQDDYDITEINDCARKVYSDTGGSQVDCPDLDCFVDSDCYLGHKQDTDGCYTCECIGDDDDEAGFVQSDIKVNQVMKDALSAPLILNGAGSGIPIWNTYKRRDGTYKIPYYVSGRIGSSGKTAITQAAYDFAKYTCLRLERRSNEKDYIYFVNKGGCFSPVGRAGGRQEVSLGRGCWNKGTAIHETLHSLGFWHEQSRPDRDSYVNINWSNIQRGMGYNFNKNSRINSRGSSYDIGSVMHYGSYAFSINGRPTITGKDQRPITTQRRGFSRRDIAQVNKMYGCKTGVTATTARPVVTATARPVVTTTRPVIVTGCRDVHVNCRSWANSGECKKNPRYMLTSCCSSCRRVKPTVGGSCQDSNGNCRSWASTGECTKNPLYMLKNCCKSCCKNTQVYCESWKKSGYCRGNYASYMKANCRKTCGYCGR